MGKQRKQLINYKQPNTPKTGSIIYKVYMAGFFYHTMLLT